MNGYLYAGILLNLVLILVNRFAAPLPDLLQISLWLIDIALMILGLIRLKK